MRSNVVCHRPRRCRASHGLDQGRGCWRLLVETSTAETSAPPGCPAAQCHSRCQSSSCPVETPETRGPDFQAIVGHVKVDRIAALMQPPRTHRHRYFGVLAPNSPLRASVTAIAAPAQQAAVQAEPATAGAPGVAPTGNALQTQPEPRPEPTKRSAAHYVSAVDRQRPETLRDRPQLRVASKLCRQLIEISAAVSDVWWADAPDRVHYRGRADQEDPGAHRRGLQGPAAIAPARGPPLWDDCVMRRWMTGRESSRTGTWRRNPHPIWMSTSASTVADQKAHAPNW